MGPALPEPFVGETSCSRWPWWQRVGGFGAALPGAEQYDDQHEPPPPSARKVIQGEVFQRPEAEPDIIHAIYDELEELEQLLTKKKPPSSCPAWRRLQAAMSLPSTWPSPRTAVVTYRPRPSKRSASPSRSWKRPG